jgi:hypothetical protein
MAGKYPRTKTHIRAAKAALAAARQYADDEYLGPTYFRQMLAQANAALDLALAEADKEIDGADNRAKAKAGAAP